MIETTPLAVCRQIKSLHATDYRFDTGKLSRKKLLVSNPLAIKGYGLLKANTMGRKKQPPHPGFLRFCRAVKQKIISEGLDQGELARDAGLSASYLSQIKNEDVGEAALQKIQRLSECLGLNAGELIFGKPELAKGSPVADVEPRYTKRRLRKKDFDTKQLHDRIVAQVLEEVRKALPRLLSLPLNQIVKEADEETLQRK